MNILKRPHIWIALALLLAPILGRLVWDYRGLPTVSQAALPDYLDVQRALPPVSTPPAFTPPGRPARTIVVIDRAHGNQFQPAELQPLTDALTARGVTVEFLQGDPPLDYRLRYAGAYVVIAPSVAHTDAEIAALRNFVASGGRLLVITDATRGLLQYDWFTGSELYLPDVDAVNPLLADHGLSITNDYIYNLTDYEGNFRNVYFRSFGEDALTAGLSQVVLYGAHSVNAGNGVPLLIGDRGTLSSLTDRGGALAGAALSASGRVLALGDLTFLAMPYVQVADNQVLLGNIADFLAAGAREPSLVNYPFVFSSQEVSIIPTGEVQWTADLLGPLAQLQASFRAYGFDLQPAAEDIGGDRILLGTYAPSEALAVYLQPLGIDLEQVTDSITLPGFGEVGISGNALLLYQPAAGGTRLIVLAETTDDLMTVLSYMSTSDFTSSCLLRADLAVCSVGYGGSFSGEETPVEEAEPTATPAG